MQSVYAAINARVANNHSHCRNVVSAFGPREFQRPDGSPVLASEALYGRECPVEETLQALGASGSALLRHVKDTEAKLTSESALTAVPIHSSVVAQCSFPPCFPRSDSDAARGARAFHAIRPVPPEKRHSSPFLLPG